MSSIRCNSPINYEEIKKDPQKITKINCFTNKYFNKGIYYPS